MGGVYFGFPVSGVVCGAVGYEGEVGRVSGRGRGGCRERGRRGAARAPRALAASGEEARDGLPRQERVRLRNLLAKTSVITRRAYFLCAKKLALRKWPRSIVSATRGR